MSNELMDDESWGDTDSIIDYGSCDEMEEDEYLGYQVYYSFFLLIGGYTNKKIHFREKQN